MHANKLTAIASPITSCAVVDDVGAKLFGQASFSTLTSNAKSDSLAKKEFIFPAKAIIEFPIFLIRGSKAVISGVFPLFEMQITTSPL